MTATYDLTTNVGNVRLLIPDTNVSDAVFTDEELTAFLALEGASVYHAAAAALETIGSSELMVQKVIRLLDLQTDGAAVSRELRMRANVLRERADKLDAADEDGAFDIAETVPNQFAYRERVFNEMLRDL